MEHVKQISATTIENKYPLALTVAERKWKRLHIPEFKVKEKSEEDISRK